MTWPAPSLAAVIAAAGPGRDDRRAVMTLARELVSAAARWPADERPPPEMLEDLRVLLAWQGAGQRLSVEAARIYARFVQQPRN